ncbi:hypothetical protein HK103_006650 [Boothiomyces macroporosus]|uniref:Uncharacterized protein n=1 Tax=Boothiomyces macroporosus TaxID=261099 RepID=A0AAD5UGN8_9FUNG|nr:hypothetical protein HK103_006650 [Boothiomyces macroporosus]
MSASACYIIASMTSWPQAQVTNFSIDLLVTLLIYSQVRPNFSIKLLAVCSFLRWFFIVPAFLVSTGYTPSYPEGLCDWIIGFADIGWFVNDQISLLSTFHRALCFTNDTTEKFVLKGLTVTSVVIGATFRLLRNPCRYQYPDGKDACWVGSGAIWDNLTVVNVIFFEMLILGFMIFKIRAFAISKVDASGMFKKFYHETIMRLVVLFPLGICEAAAYIVQQTPGAPTWLNWVLTIAVYCRQFNPLIISVLIVCAKFNVPKTNNASLVKSVGTTQNLKSREKVLDE